MNREELHKIVKKYSPIADEEELWWLVQKLEQIKPLETIIEIGVAGGGTFKIWEQLLPPERGLLIGVDIEPSSPSRWNKGNNPVYNSVQLIPSERNIAVYMVYGDSTDLYTISRVGDILNKYGRGRVIAGAAEWEVDFLYIDGHHEYYEVTNDYHNYGAFVRSGGAIAFHDYGTQWVNYVFENEAVGRKERITKAHGIGIVYV